MLKADGTDFLALSREMLDRGSRLCFRAHGRSMYPFIRDGYVLAVEPFNAASARVGDVIFYHLPDGSPTAHRLISRDNNVLMTRGDSLNYCDPPVRPEQVMGRVVEVEGRCRRLTLTSRTGRAFGLLIARSALGRYPSQRRVMRNLGRLLWLLGARRIK